MVPDGVAAVAGIQVGDTLLSLDGKPISNSADFTFMVGRHRVGDHILIRLLHAGQETTKTVVLTPRPYESSPDAEVLCFHHCAGNRGLQSAARAGAAAENVLHKTGDFENGQSR